MPQDTVPPCALCALRALRGCVAGGNEPSVVHELRIEVGEGGRLSGLSTWPAQRHRGLPPRSFVLHGKVAANGRFEFADDAPERLPGFRRGLYVGRRDPLRAHLRGEYYELDEQTQALFYLGDWTAA